MGRDEMGKEIQKRRPKDGKLDREDRILVEFKLVKQNGLSS